MARGVVRARVKDGGEGGSYKRVIETRWCWFGLARAVEEGGQSRVGPEMSYLWPKRRLLCLLGLFWFIFVLVSTYNNKKENYRLI